MKELWPAILRLIRVSVAQGIGALIVSLSGANIPYLGISIGAVISAAAKFLRDKFPAYAEWLPV